MRTQKGYITRQANRLRSGEINRRRFVMQALSAGVSMPTAMSLAARAEASVPRRGGTLRLALDGDPGQHAAFITGNALTERRADGQVAGELAVDFSSTKGARAWSFLIRDDIAFHDGRSLRPEDVIASFERMGRQDAFTRNIARIGIEDRTVIFDLTEPDASFPAQLARPSHAIRRDDPLAGTGPYILEGIADDRLSFVRNPTYWKHDAAHFDRIELLSHEDRKSRLHAILNGEVDYADNIDPRAVGLIQRASLLRTAEHESTALLGFQLSLRDRDPLLQKALSLALPRQALVDKVFLGHGKCHEAATDLTRARAAYSKASHTGPLTLAASERDYPGATDAARLFVSEAQTAGIDIDLVDGVEDADIRTAALPEGTDTSLAVIHHNAIFAASQSLAGLDRITGDPHRIAERCWFS